MKKKYFIILLVIVLVLVFVIVGLVVSFKNKALVYINPIATSSTTMIVNTPKPFPVEFMSETERAAYSFASTTPSKIQVMSRNKDGKITSYKLIKNDSDIITQY